jgi:glycosyltransferase involved in cell wall biosynthesis
MMQTSSPQISIITINRNKATGLARTLESVACQTYRNFEHLVLDGASTDDSTAVLEHYRPQLAHAVSEPDHGIYDAMNKGIARARGNHLLFLNSGDYLRNPEALALAAPHLDGPDLVYFDLEVSESACHSRIESFPDTLDYGYFARHSLPHPSTFIAASLFQRYGPYDTSLRIVSDWKAFLLWVCKHNCTYRHVPKPLTIYSFDGVSSRSESAPILQAERLRVLEGEFPAVHRTYLQSEATARRISRIRQRWFIRALCKTGLLEAF